MRPLTLELEGFTAFRNRTCLDFSALDLFAITGPTGAGKSSLIDAICYALYGRVPRVTTEVGACISLGLDRMQVTLVFEAGETRYRILRETRRRGNGNTRLEKLSDDGEDWQPISDRAREVTQKVEEIVGLDFEAFIRSALLPQGQFQEFLAGSPDRRRDVLRRLLRLEVYERMQTSAGREAQRLQIRVAEIERRLGDELADATPQTLALRKQELTDAQTESKRLEAAITVLRGGIDGARQLASARADLARYVSTFESAQTRLVAAREQVASGDGQLTLVREELSDLQVRLAANDFDEELFAALTGAANLALTVERGLKALRDADAGIATLEKTVIVAMGEAQSSAKAQVEARALLEAAQIALEEERRHDLAAALQAGLQPGDACPVCSGVVGQLVAIAPAGLEGAQRAFEGARRNDEAQRTAASTASTKAAVAEERLAAAKTQVEQQQAQLSRAAKELEEALPGLADRSLAVIQAGIGAQRASREERARLQKDTADLARTLAVEEQRLNAARTDLAGLEAGAKAAREAVAQAEAAVTAAAQGLLAEATAHGWTIEAELRAGRDPLPQLESSLREATSRHQTLLMASGRLEEQISHLRQDIETAKVLREELMTRKSEHDVAADLAQMLRADRFQAYVQSEAMRSLAEDGSRRLEALSAGRYELEVAEGGQDFAVKDKWNADEQRSVRTLSGGETFLASLALALALAESLPGLAPGRRLALDSIFLDEGFGSLDPEALERAADALDALRMENRLVCVITHLKELAERLPAHVVVNKTDSGSSISLL